MCFAAQVPSVFLLCFYGKTAVQFRAPFYLTNHYFLSSLAEWVSLP